MIKFSKSDFGGKLRVDSKLYMVAIEGPKRGSLVVCRDNDDAYPYVDIDGTVMDFSSDAVVAVGASFEIQADLPELLSWVKVRFDGAEYDGQVVTLDKSDSRLPLKVFMVRNGEAHSEWISADNVLETIFPGNDLQRFIDSSD